MDGLVTKYVLRLGPPNRFSRTFFPDNHPDMDATAIARLKTIFSLDVPVRDDNEDFIKYGQAALIGLSKHTALLMSVRLTINVIPDPYTNPGEKPIPTVFHLITPRKILGYAHQFITEQATATTNTLARSTQLRAKVFQDKRCALGWLEVDNGFFFFTDELMFEKMKQFLKMDTQKRPLAPVVPIRQSADILPFPSRT